MTELTSSCEIYIYNRLLQTMTIVIFMVHLRVKKLQLESAKYFKLYAFETFNIFLEVISLATNISTCVCNYGNTFLSP